MTSLDHVQVKELEHRATARFAAALSVDTFLSSGDLIEGMTRRGCGMYAPRSKSAVDVIRTSDTGISFPQLDAAVLQRVDDDQSLLGRCPGVTRMPLTGTARIQITLVAASLVGEGDVKPLSHTTFTEPGPPVKVVTLLVVSADVLRDPTTQDGLRQVSVSSVRAGTDAAVVSALTSGAPIGSATPGSLLAAISGGQPQQPTLIGGFDTLLSLDAGTIRDLQALGVSVLASSAAAGLLIALDQPGLLIAADEIRIDVARHADVLMDDLNPPGGATTINLFQSNAIGLRCERLLKIGVRPDATAWASVGTP
jgi:hypothetical protein